MSSRSVDGTLARKEKRVRRLSRWMLGAEVVWELVFAGIATKLPERWYFRLYRLTAHQTERDTDEKPAQEQDLRRAARIGRAVGIVADASPFRWVCLQQSLATYSMLRRRRLGAEVLFGLRAGAPAAALDQQPTDVSAHAWVKFGGFAVNGYRDDLASFAVVGRYV